jgi:hypothetical protein
MAALSRIAGGTTGETTKRQTPIFQREPAITEKQSIQDAANALAALWKIVKPWIPHAYSRNYRRCDFAQKHSIVLKDPERF